MTETEMLKEPRIIVAKVAHADQASGRVPAHVLQAKVTVREEPPGSCCFLRPERRCGR